MKSIDSIWDDLFAYWKENEPAFTQCDSATDQEIIELEKYLQPQLPNEFKQSLGRCNNYPKDPTDIQKSSCNFTGGGGILFDINTIYELHNEYKEYMYDGGAYGKIDPRLDPKDIVWSHYWIPIYSWNCDEMILLDLREDIKDQYGQILYLDQEYDTLGICTNSYQEFLELISNAILDHGAFDRNDMKKIRERVLKNIEK